MVCLIFPSFPPSISLSCCPSFSSSLNGSNIPLCSTTNQVPNPALTRQACCPWAASPSRTGIFRFPHWNLNFISSMCELLRCLIWGFVLYGRLGFICSSYIIRVTRSFQVVGAALKPFALKPLVYSKMSLFTGHNLWPYRLTNSAVSSHILMRSLTKGSLHYTTNHMKTTSCNTLSLKQTSLAGKKQTNMGVGQVKATVKDLQCQSKKVISLNQNSACLFVRMEK